MRLLLQSDTAVETSATAIEPVAVRGFALCVPSVKERAALAFRSLSLAAPAAAER